MSNIRAPTYKYLKNNIILGYCITNLSPDEFLMALAKYVFIFWIISTTSDITTSKAMDLRKYLHSLATHCRTHPVPETIYKLLYKIYA